MRVVATSDLHGYLPKVPGCDLLLVAGDVCPVRDHSVERQHRWLTGLFSDWLRGLDAEVVVGIGGNHDFALERIEGLGHSLPWTYLQDQALRFNEHLIYGSPWTPPFQHWAFMLQEDRLAERYRKVPRDTTILVTHGPPHGTLDEVATLPRERVGSRALAIRVRELPELRLHVFGHIHEQRGWEQSNHLFDTFSEIPGVRKQGVLPGHVSANVSYVDLQYRPYPAPWEIEVFDL